jgi:SecY interacting protein Syd
MGEVARELLRLLQRGSAVRREHDAEWPSPCELLPPDDNGYVVWRPVPMQPPATFFGISLHPSIREFYGSYWGGRASGEHSGEAVNLMVAWNEDDLGRITNSLREHVAAGVPVLVAYTDSDWYFGVDNTTGAVWLCEPGCPPMREVAPSLAAFLVRVH